MALEPVTRSDQNARFDLAFLLRDDGIDPKRSARVRLGSV
jgi:hypothetical protein